MANLAQSFPPKRAKPCWALFEGAALFYVMTKSGRNSLLSALVWSITSWCPPSPDTLFRQTLVVDPIGVTMFCVQLTRGGTTGTVGTEAHVHDGEVGPASPCQDPRRSWLTSRRRCTASPSSSASSIGMRFHRTYKVLFLQVLLTADFPPSPSSLEG